MALASVEFSKLALCFQLGPTELLEAKQHTCGPCGTGFVNPLPLALNSPTPLVLSIPILCGILYYNILGAVNNGVVEY